MTITNLFSTIYGDFQAYGTHLIMTPGSGLSDALCSIYLYPILVLRAGDAGRSLDVAEAGVS